MNPSSVSVELFLGDDDASHEQREVLRKVSERFPGLVVKEHSLDSKRAEELGIFLAPGMVIEGIILGVGKVVSAGKIRRFLEQYQDSSRSGEVADGGKD